MKKAGKVSRSFASTESGFNLFFFFHGTYKVPEFSAVRIITVLRIMSRKLVNHATSAILYEKFICVAQNLRYYFLRRGPLLFLWLQRTSSFTTRKSSLGNITRCLCLYLSTKVRRFKPLNHISSTNIWILIGFYILIRFYRVQSNHSLFLLVHEQYVKKFIERAKAWVMD